MASTDRRSTRDLIAEIGKDGPRFRFFQAVRLIALSAKDGNRSAVPAGLRFGTPLTLTFQASEISEVEPRPPMAHALPPDEDDPEEAEADRLALLITVGFMGMTGPSGVLPNAYTELLMERKNFFRDTSAHGFLDLFSHRAISLFYQSWRKHRFYLAYEAGDRDSFSRNLLDIVGMGLAPLQSRLEKQGGVPDMFLAHFAGLLSQKPVSAVNLAAALKGYFDVDAKIEQFIGQWIAVPDDEQTCLGRRSCGLGVSAFAGERIWDRQNKFRITLGPLTDAQFADFLPGMPGANAMTELVRFCVGQSLACDVTLELQKDCIPVARLDKSAPVQLRLGYNTWMHQHAPNEHAKDACFSLLQ